jgi:hypothetical protein
LPRALEVGGVHRARRRLRVGRGRQRSRAAHAPHLGGDQLKRGVRAGLRKRGGRGVERGGGVKGAGLVAFPQRVSSRAHVCQVKRASQST